MKKILLIMLTLSLLGCVHNIKLTHFQTGQTLHGEYNQMNRTVTVTMPNGEVLRGQYSAVSDNSRVTILKPGKLPLYAYSRGKGKAYALLTSKTSNLVMEIIVEYGGDGFGIAKTNDGRTYRV